MLVVVSSAAVTAAADGPPLVSLEVAESWHLDYPTHHVQGLCVSGEYFWVSSVSRADRAGWVYRFDRATLQRVVERNIADGELFHPGGMQLVGRDLWVPLAEYRPRSSARVLRLDANTLETKDSFDVDDHLGGAAYGGPRRLFAANWDARIVYRFDEEGNVIAPLPSTTGVAYQDMEYHDGQLWGVGQTRLDGRARAVVDVLDPATLQLQRRYVLEGMRRSGGDAFGREGLALFEGDIYVLPEDAPDTTVYRFPLPGAD